MRSLPFLIDDLNAGFMKAEGILSVNGNKLHFEFQIKDAVMEAYKSEVKEAELDLRDLDLVEFKKGFFSSKMIIHAKKAKTLEILPGNDLVERVLKVKKKHRETAASMASTLNMKISEYKLSQLED